MKRVIWLPVAFFLVSCASPTQPQTSATSTPAIATVTQAPILTPTPDLMSTLIAKGPLIEVTFDGNECTISEPNEVPIGDQGVVFTDLSDTEARMYVGRNFPGVTWEYFLGYIATPSSTPIPGGFIVMASSHFKLLDSNTTYRQYKLELEGEYHIVLEAMNLIWPCGPFFVVADP